MFSRDLSTRRRPERPTTGTAVALLADLGGMTLQPWQRYVADVAGELIPNPDPNPLPWHPAFVHAYSHVTISVGRRAGKSTLTVARAAMCAGTAGTGFYTAQNHKSAAARHRHDWAPFVRRSPRLCREFTVRLSNGSEAIESVDTGGHVGIFAPLPTALHGDAADWIAFDEAWAHTRERGTELEVAAYPLLATRPGAQIWAMSAAGDADSTWWLDTLDAGRAAVADDTGTGVCHFEWTAGDDDDLDDPDVWLRAHPSIRTAENPTGMVTLEYLRTEHERDPDQFARAWLNINNRTGHDALPIDPAIWEGLATTGKKRPAAVTIGVACTPEQSHTALVAAYGDTVEVVDMRDGFDWVADRLTDLDRRWQIDAVAIDAAGSSPAAVLRRPLQQTGLRVHAMTLADATAAAADFASDIRQGRLRQVPHPAFDTAVAAARRRTVGDGAWLWHREAGNVAAIEAATLARWVSPDVHALATPNIR